MPVTSGKIKVTVPPDSIWTLSTLTGATKGGGGGVGKDQPQKDFPLPYTEDFEAYALDTLPKYLLRGIYINMQRPETQTGWSTRSERSFER